jgi:hypothetical protein
LWIYSSEIYASDGTGIFGTASEKCQSRLTHKLGVAPDSGELSFARAWAETTATACAQLADEADRYLDVFNGQSLV